MKTICKLYAAYGVRGNCATCPYDCPQNWNTTEETEADND